jgi:hypothetical protein
MLDPREHILQGRHDRRAQTFHILRVILARAIKPIPANPREDLPYKLIPPRAQPPGEAGAHPVKRLPTVVCVPARRHVSLILTAVSPIA